MKHMIFFMETYGLPVLPATTPTHYVPNKQSESCEIDRDNICPDVKASGIGSHDPQRRHLFICVSYIPSFSFPPKKNKSLLHNKLSSKTRNLGFVVKLIAERKVALM